MSFTDVVKRKMDEIKLRPCDLAKSTGYSQQYINDLLTGKRRWNETTMEKVSVALSIKIEFNG